MEMGKLNTLFLRTYDMSASEELEFFDCIADFYYTDEIQQMSDYSQHGSVQRLQHMHSVAYISYKIAKKLDLDYYSTARGAILHDLFFYECKKEDFPALIHGKIHPFLALKNARSLSRKINIQLSDLEEDIICRHMFPLTPVPPKYKESYIVSMVDKYVATMEIIMYISEKMRHNMK